MGVDLLDLWGQMGMFVKGVVIVMAIMSVWSLSIVVAKFIEFRRSTAATRKFAPEFSRSIQEEQLDQAIAVAEKHKKSHVARVLGEALEEVKPLLRDRATVTAADINSAERAVERQMLLELSKLRRGLALLATVGATAPFVGLLGTTMGIVNSFAAMSNAGASSGLAGISAGIAEALIATAFGLLVAIPAVWAYNYFTNKLDFMTAEMTFTSKELIDYLIKSVGSEFGRSIFTKEFQAQKAVSGSGHIHG
jgi:biopolymer transport protein ExbB/biopolymer transport protein TolQ